MAALEIHRWRGGVSSDPADGANWDDGVDPGTPGTATLTLTLIPSDGETVTIQTTRAGSTVYTFRTAINNAVPREVLIGASLTTARDNLVACVNLAAGSGTLYSSSTPNANDLVVASAVSTDQMLWTSIALGQDGAGELLPSETLAAGSWSAVPFLDATTNWSYGAMIFFDGVSSVPCDGTTALDGFRLVLRQDSLATQNIGSAAKPFRFNMTNNVEHKLQGSGALFFANGESFPISGGAPRNPTVRINRPPHSDIVTWASPVPAIVEQGVVHIESQPYTTSDVFPSVLADGPFADVTIVTGTPPQIVATGGKIICNDPVASASTWIANGGTIENHGVMATGTVVDVTAGSFVVMPDVAPLETDNVRFYITGGVLDLSQTPFEFFGSIVKGQGGTILGSALLSAVGPPL